MSADEIYVAQLITSQRAALRYYFCFGLAIFLLGALILLFTFAWPRAVLDEKFRTVLGIGGGFVSSLSGFQVKEFINRRESVGMLKLLQAQLGSGEDLNQAERKRIRELLWKVVEKTTLE